MKSDNQISEESSLKIGEALASCHQFIKLKISLK